MPFKRFLKFEESRQNEFFGGESEGGITFKKKKNSLFLLKYIWLNSLSIKVGGNIILPASTPQQGVNMYQKNQEFGKGPG